MPFIILIHIPNFNDAHHLFQGREFKRIETRSPRDEKFRLFIGREVKAFFDIFFFPSCFCFLLKRVGLSRDCGTTALYTNKASSIFPTKRLQTCSNKIFRNSETIDPCRFSMYNMAGLTGTRPAHRKNNNHECVRRTRKL